MSFQIQNKEGEALGINALDVEAAAFWCVEVHPKNYASPIPKMHGTNWFDIIGWCIHDQGYYTLGWNNVKCTMHNIHTSDFGMITLEERIETLRTVDEFLKPYFNLIDHWESIGYKPVQIKE